MCSAHDNVTTVPLSAMITKSGHQVQSSAPETKAILGQWHISKKHGIAGMWHHQPSAQSGFIRVFVISGLVIAGVLTLGPSLANGGGGYIVNVVRDK